MGTNVATTKTLIFRQLFEKESSTYTYLLADAETKEVSTHACAKSNLCLCGA